jgi:peptidoglycan/xylan/chitin deacetylase (PgdA/CDA1 family)
MRWSNIVIFTFLACLGAAAQSGGISSGLPALHKSGVPRPSGAAGGLKVLDWAGFNSALTYTFDDSLPSQIENYPQLHATGARMTFFLASSNGVNPAWAQIGKDGNELGNHTAHHCRANATDCAWGAYAGSLEAEYDLCSAFLKEKYGASEVWTTATPYGDKGYDEVAKTRFFLNRGVQGGQIAPNDLSDPYNLPIFGASAGDTADKFNAAIDSSHSSGKWLIFMFHSLGGDGGYAPVDVKELLASVGHAQSFGDVWIDSMVNVGAYWAGQKAIAQAKSTQSGKKTILTWTLPPHFPPGRSVRVTVSGGVLQQNGKVLPWNGAGYYEVALDAGELTITK